MHTPAPDLSLMKKREGERQRVDPFARRSSSIERQSSSNEGYFVKLRPRVDSVFGPVCLETLSHAIVKDPSHSNATQVLQQATQVPSDGVPSLSSGHTLQHSSHSLPLHKSLSFQKKS